jgi:hypothetical protein
MDRLSLYWGADDDVEDIERNTSGGFHPIHLGDVLSSPQAQYRVLHKLGRGAFSTVWSAETLQELSVVHPPLHSSTISQHYVAIKVCVADADPKHELEVHNRLSRTFPAPSNVLQLQVRDFSSRGPNGVLVQDVLGSLLSVVGSPNGPRPKHVETMPRHHSRARCVASSGDSPRKHVQTCQVLFSITPLR